MRVVVLLAAISFCAAAQRVSGVPAGHGGGAPGWGNPSPIGPPFGGAGRYPWWGGRRPYTFGNYGPFPAGFDTPLCASPLFPLAPPCSFGDAGGFGYDAPPPIPPSPTINVVVMPPAPFPVPVANGASEDDLSQTSQMNPAGDRPAPSGISQAPPLPSPPVQSDYPPVLVLKTGGMYSITKYWVKGKTVYFVTTAGDTLYAPVALLDRVLPGSKP